jgi:hypothetical protein
MSGLVLVAAVMAWAAGAVAVRRTRDTEPVTVPVESEDE